MSHARLIVNPKAGAGKSAKQWPQIMALLKDIGLRFEYDLTEAPGHAIELAKSAVKMGYDLVVSVGGDGTLNEIVNGLYENGCIGNVTLGIIGTGTGSDYIRTIGIPRDYKEACQRLLNPQKRLVDLGVVEYTSNGQLTKRLFVNFAGMGFDAEVVKATTQRFKALGSRFSYLGGLLNTFLFYKNKEISIMADGKIEKRRVCAVVVSNGRYGGGSMLVAPDADTQDGLLDVVVIDDVNKLDLLWSLPRIYKGTHLTHPKVIVKRLKEIDLRCSLRMSIQADGELLGEAPAHFSVLPATLNITV